MLAGVVGTAWVALVAWGSSPYSRYLDHGGTSGIAGVALFTLGWTLMITATMLPTATGLLGAFRPVARRHAQPALLLGALVAAFLLTWAAVGLLMYGADVALHGAVDRWPSLESNSHLLTAAVLLAAGAYQWTSIKDRCLTRCRTPRSFVYRFWRGGRPTVDAVQMGLAYGRSCVGCCWALMLLMFAVGSGSVGWMLALGAVMAVEKNVERGRRISRPVGAVLLALGAAVALGLSPGR